MIRTNTYNKSRARTRAPEALFLVRTNRGYLAFDSFAAWSKWRAAR